ncbi:hypothetical protein BC833DRAFT_556465 [Globomyces pollinis-pini]|nr:hypothetical protein BC833DRAFT_556465 [Globomyces pollinis-pini]
MTVEESMDAFSIDWILLQLADSALPTGGFVASGGLEAYVQTNHMVSLDQFITNSLSSMAFSNIPFIRSTWIALENRDLNEIVEIDRRYNALLGSNHVNKRASCAQGVAYLTLITKSFPKVELLDFITDFKLLIRANKTLGHLAICFTVACYSLGLDCGKVEFLFLFLHVRAVVSSAIRMSLIGPYEGQQVIFDSKSKVGTILKLVNNKLLKPILPETDLEALLMGEGVEELAVSTSPLLDIVQGSHDRLYTRIFNS